MHIKEIITEATRTYTGEPLEKGGTSIKGQGAAPVIKKLASSGIFEGKTVLDYGAGKYGRNADAIRASGAKVFAYDPFHGSGSDGFSDVAGTLPNTKFDIAFTSYVLNVVPEKTEDQILGDIESKANSVFHITRNMDIFQSVKKALARKDKTVGNFFLEQFANEEEREAYEEGNLSDETVMDFCKHGVQTSRGFQRIPELENKGYNLKQNTTGYKFYTKGF